MYEYVYLCTCIICITSVRTCVYYAHTYMHVCIFYYLYVCTYVYSIICMYVCTHIFIYICCPQDLMGEVQARSGDVKSAQEVGEEMLADLEGKEKEKMQKKLQGLTASFSDLDDTLNRRMEELDDARAKAGDFEDKETTFDEWLAEKEKELNEWDVLPVNSAALEQQMDKIEVSVCLCIW